MEKKVKIGRSDNSGFQVLPALRPSQQWLAQDRHTVPRTEERARSWTYNQQLLFRGSGGENAQREHTSLPGRRGKPAAERSPSPSALGPRRGRRRN